jgi:hypothetical protein
LLEWQTCDTEVEWQAAVQATPADAVAGPTPALRLAWVARRRRIAAALLTALLIVLVTAGGWVWHTANTGLELLEAEVGDTVNADVWTETQRTADVELLDLADDVAVVEMTLPAVEDRPALRQPLVYQRIDAGWLRTAPTAALWDVSRRLETTYFVFRIFDQDAKAVKAAAARLDALYPTVYGSFLPGMPRGEKLMVQVDPAQPPGEIAKRATNHDPLVVASPAAYLAPEAISQADLLAQSVVLALLEALKTQGAQRYSDEPYSLSFRSGGISLWQWLAGVQLWQLWANDLPLAAWREPVVQWVFSDLYDAQGNLQVAPDFMPEFCALHGLWVYTPMQVQIPLSCDSPDRLVHYLAWRIAYPRPVQLGQLAMPIAADAAPGLQSVMGEAGRSPHPAAAVALATVLEYAAETYGPERIPLLLAALNQHARAETLIPAVFGVSAIDFEAGWQAYLAEQYGVSEAH